MSSDQLSTQAQSDYLAGRFAEAETALEESLRRAERSGEDGTDVAYWLARVQLLLDRPDALERYEQRLRRGPASPRATIWFVDLLWRAGRLERAEAVWKSLRGNRRIVSLEETPLLEARSLLRQGELARAEQVLRDAAPQSGIAQAERLLLLAWVLTGQGQIQRAGELLHGMTAPYSGPALQHWRALWQARHEPQKLEFSALSVSARVLPLIRGQQTRLEGNSDEAVRQLTAGSDEEAILPFLRYALACLGREDFAALLASQPGLFLALRCRARETLERFRRREASAAEFLDALDRAAAVQYFPYPIWRRLASLLVKRSMTPDEVAGLVAEGDAADQPNRLRVAFELTDLLPAADALHLLTQWAKPQILSHGEKLRDYIGIQILRKVVESGAAEIPPTVEPLPTDDPRVALTRFLLRPGVETCPAVCRYLLEQRERLPDLAQCLLLHQAVATDNLPETLTLLAGRAPSVPPQFVLRTLAYALSRRPAHVGLRRAIAEWLSRADLAALPPEGRTLALQVGLLPLDPERADPPAGVPLVPWLLHQTSQNVAKEQFAQALAWVRRALAEDPALNDAGPQVEAVQAALPELERLARADVLARVARFHPEQPPWAAPLLVEAVELLDAAEPTFLPAASRGDIEAARAVLAQVAGRPELTTQLSHPLALIYHRGALFLEERAPDEASTLWTLAWQCWSVLLRSADGRRSVLLNHLLGIHRRWLNVYLSSNRIDRARRHWEWVHRAGFNSDELAAWRNDLAAEYITLAREASKQGTIPEGWSGNHEKGLEPLRRLLSLDRDNPRLLTALIEMCLDWLMDCYNNQDFAGLYRQVERFTPIALKLARVASEADLASRGALSDFTKFRAFMAPDLAARITLYREALRFNPANDNVRHLLEKAEASGA
jgi:hypothetical protein